MPVPNYLSIRISDDGKAFIKDYAKTHNSTVSKTVQVLIQLLKSSVETKQEAN